MNHKVCAVLSGARQKLQNKKKAPTSIGLRRFLEWNGTSFYQLESSPPSAALPFEPCFDVFLKVPMVLAWPNSETCVMAGVEAAALDESVADPLAGSSVLGWVEVLMIPRCCLAKGRRRPAKNEKKRCRSRCRTAPRTGEVAPGNPHRSRVARRPSFRS